MLNKGFSLILLLIGWAGCTAAPNPGEIARIHHEPVEGRSGYDVVIREVQPAPDVYVREADESHERMTFEVKDLRTEELDKYINQEPTVAIKTEMADGYPLQLRRQRNLLRRYRNLALYETQKQKM